MSAPALEVDQLSLHFGSLRAVHEVSLTVERGSHHAVIGPNGAGKSSLFGLIAGTLPATSGAVRLYGEDITALAEPRRVGRGLVRTFQHSSLFLSATVLENVLLAAQRRAGVSWSMFRPLSRRHDLLERAHTLLGTVDLEDRHAARAGALSHGERRQLEVAIALACEPSVVMLDEPAAGMSGAETAQLAQLVTDLPKDVTVLLVEHDLDLVFDLADIVTVLHLGEHIITGTPDEVRRSDEVQTAYLGAADTSDLFLKGPA